MRKRKNIIVGNWKMNGNQQSVQQLYLDVLGGMNTPTKASVVVCVPTPYLLTISQHVKGGSLMLGAQNVNDNKSGSFTGEVSASMLKDCGVDFVIVGHSERRQLYAESDTLIAKKINMALKHNITPLFCVGESLEQKEKNKTIEALTQQINTVINYIGTDALRRIIIAYEPVWAIGAGISASPDEAQEVHLFIRDLLNQHQAGAGDVVSIIYGGSMNSKNAPNLLACKDIDGGLIGGASLAAQSFLDICKAA